LYVIAIPPKAEKQLFLLISATLRLAPTTTESR